MEKKVTVAVVFGGPSYEHDVSILSGLQAAEALDPLRYDIMPIYISKSGEWLTGSALLARDFYPLDGRKDRDLIPITPLHSDYESVGRCCFQSKNQYGLLRQHKYFYADIVFPILHGDIGENGAVQGLFEVLGFPYVGCRVLASAISMSKSTTKQICHSLGIPTVPGQVISLHYHNDLTLERLKQKFDGEGFPYCVKPNHLGSSVGVYRANNWQELSDKLYVVAQLDTQAIVESFIPNLVEYNISVTHVFGEIQVSAIERPLRVENILAFKDKYLSEDMSSKLYHNKQTALFTDNRVFHPPELNIEQRQSICDWARMFFSKINGLGVCRIDFLSNEQTGELWFNEINPIPGSLAFYLWEAANPPVSFSELLSGMIQEGMQTYLTRRRQIDLSLTQTNIFH